MHAVRRWWLRRRYLRLRARYYNILDDYDYGIALAEYINPELVRLNAEMGNIEAEVGLAIGPAQRRRE